MKVAETGYVPLVQKVPAEVKRARIVRVILYKTNGSAPVVKILSMKHRLRIEMSG